LTLDDFVYCEEDTEMMEKIIAYLNQTIRIYRLAGKDKEPEIQQMMLLSAKRMLPDGFIQQRMVNTNYAELMNIYHQRKNHRLKEEWGAFCTWCESIPSFKELCIDPIKTDKGE